MISMMLRNKSYHTRIQLAILNYNAHLDCDKAKNKNREVICNVKFRKQTKNLELFHLLH